MKGGGKGWERKRDKESKELKIENDGRKKKHNNAMREGEGRNGGGRDGGEGGEGRVVESGGGGGGGEGERG